MDWKEFFKHSISKILLAMLLTLASLSIFTYDRSGCPSAPAGVQVIDCGFAKRGFPVPFYQNTPIPANPEILWPELIADFIFFYLLSSLAIYLLPRLRSS